MGTENGAKRNLLERVKGLTGGLGAKFRRGAQWYNHALSKVYSPRTAALTGTLIVLVIAVVLLFIPPYVGVADDGSLNQVLKDTALGYRLRDLEYPVGAYFVRVFMHSTYQPQGLSTHRLLVRAAMWLDDQFTGDNLFDIRFLAAIYTLMYLPAVYLVLRGIASRVKVAAEATFLVILGALMMGDNSAISFFNSLYPEALWQIGLIYCLGLCMCLQHTENRWEQLGFLGLASIGSILVLSESHMCMVGFTLTIFCLRQLAMEEKTEVTTVLTVSAAVVLAVASVISMGWGASRFTDSSKLHAMTNGVLLRSQNPEETLAEFGIDPRFETLTDISSYSDYPYTLAGNPELLRDFLDKYSTGSIILHYVRDPLAYVAMVELGTQAAFNPVRGYVGNFESSTGMPERARNPLFVFYGDLKGNSLPSTLGFLAILAVAYWALFRQRRGIQHHIVRWTFRERQIMLDTFLWLLLTGIAHISGIIVLSGTAELERYQMVYGVCVDGMLLLFLAEILHRLNILNAED